MKKDFQVLHTSYMNILLYFSVGFYFQVIVSNLHGDLLIVKLQSFSTNPLTVLLKSKIKIATSNIKKIK